MTAQEMINDSFKRIVTELFVQWDYFVVQLNKYNADDERSLKSNKMQEEMLNLIVLLYKKLVEINKEVACENVLNYIYVMGYKRLPIIAEEQFTQHIFEQEKSNTIVTT